jgi:hypothetical protein
MTPSQKKATTAAIIRIAEMTVKYAKGARRQEAIEHLKQLKKGKQ